jgi:hypothetical protein
VGAKKWRGEESGALEGTRKDGHRVFKLGVVMLQERKRKGER